MAGQSGRRMAELFCRPDQLSVSPAIRRTTHVAVAPRPATKVAKGPLYVGKTCKTGQDVLAEAERPTPVAEPTIYRQRFEGRNPREEPDALAGTSGSVRGAPGNRRSYRDCLLGWTPALTGTVSWFLCRGCTPLNFPASLGLYRSRAWSCMDTSWLSLPIPSKTLDPSCRLAYCRLYYW